MLPLPPIESLKIVLPKYIESPSNKLPPLPDSKKSFSGIKDVDLMILMKLNDKDLFNTCKVDKYVNRICRDENFWRVRFYNKHGEYNKAPNITWRNLYLKEHIGYNLYREGQGRVRGYVAKQKINPEDQLILIDVEIPNYKSQYGKRSLWGMMDKSLRFRANWLIKEEFRLYSPLFESENKLREWRKKSGKDFRQYTAVSFLFYE